MSDVKEHFRRLLDANELLESVTCLKQALLNKDFLLDSHLIMSDAKKNRIEWFVSALQKLCHKFDWEKDAEIAENDYAKLLFLFVRLDCVESNLRWMQGILCDQLSCLMCKMNRFDLALRLLSLATVLRRTDISVLKRLSNNLSVIRTRWDRCNDSRSELRVKLMADFLIDNGLIWISDADKWFLLTFELEACRANKELSLRIVKAIRCSSGGAAKSAFAFVEASRILYSNPTLSNTSALECSEHALERLLNCKEEPDTLFRIVQANAYLWKHICLLEDRRKANFSLEVQESDKKHVSPDSNIDELRSTPNNDHTSLFSVQEMHEMYKSTLGLSFKIWEDIVSHSPISFQPGDWLSDYAINVFSTMARMLMLHPKPLQAVQVFAWLYSKRNTLNNLLCLFTVAFELRCYDFCSALVGLTVKCESDLEKTLVSICHFAVLAVLDQIDEALEIYDAVESKLTLCEEDSAPKNRLHYRCLSLLRYYVTYLVRRPLNQVPKRFRNERRYSLLALQSSVHENALSILLSHIGPQKCHFRYDENEWLAFDCFWFLLRNSELSQLCEQMGLIRYAESYLIQGIDFAQRLGFAYWSVNSLKNYLRLKRRTDKLNEESTHNYVRIFERLLSGFKLHDSTEKSGVLTRFTCKNKDMIEALPTIDTYVKSAAAGRKKGASKQSKEKTVKTVARRRRVRLSSSSASPSSATIDAEGTILKSAPPPIETSRRINPIEVASIQKSCADINTPPDVTANGSCIDAFAERHASDCACVFCEDYFVGPLIWHYCLSTLEKPPATLYISTLWMNHCSRIGVSLKYSLGRCAKFLQLDQSSENAKQPRVAKDGILVSVNSNRPIASAKGGSNTVAEYPTYKMHSLLGFGSLLESVACDAVLRYRSSSRDASQALLNLRSWTSILGQQDDPYCMRIIGSEVLLLKLAEIELELESFQVAAVTEGIRKLGVKNSRSKSPKKLHDTKNHIAEPPRPPQLDENTLLKKLEEYLENYGHLMYYEWYRKTNEILAVRRCKAYHFLECFGISYRHICMLSDMKSKTVESNVHKRTSVIQDDEHLIRLLKNIPYDLTVVCLYLTSERHLYLIRLSARHVPEIVELGDVQSKYDALSRIKEINKESAESSSLTDAKEFWTRRSSLDEQLKVLVKRIEEDWFGYFKVFLLGVKKTRNKLDLKATDSLEEVLQNSTDRLSAEDLRSLCSRYNRKFGDQLASMFEDAEASSSMQGPVILVLDKDLHSLPWESLHILKDQPVSRSLSIHALIDSVRNWQRNSAIERSNAYYVLNPARNLQKTENAFKDVFNKLGWDGVIGTVPSVNELQQALTSKDMLVYCGHGNGFAYGLGCNDISTLKSTVMLMGCASAKHVPSGFIYEPQSVITNYQMMHCPSVVGCLWNVTDRDIDCYFDSLLRIWLRVDDGRVNTHDEAISRRQRQRQRSASTRDAEFLPDAAQLPDAVRLSRLCCKLTFLTGAAPVIYGLPVAALRSHSAMPSSSAQC